MKKEDLLWYEAPAITEKISIDWIQNIMARYIAWKINRKWERYQKRLKRALFLENLIK